MFELALAGSRDLNGDSKIDSNDQYGYLTGPNMELDAYVMSFDVPLYDTTGGGLKLAGLTEKYVDVWEALRSFCADDAVYYGSDNTVNMFMSGKGLFMGQQIRNTLTMRQMDDDYGILPYPKWDSSQENFISYAAIGNATAYGITVTADAEKIGAVLNAFAYYGEKMILPEYYEVNLKGKQARDSESERMLDIIFANVTNSFGIIMMNSPAMLIRSTISTGNEITSTYESNLPKYEADIEKVLEYIK